MSSKVKKSRSARRGAKQASHAPPREYTEEELEMLDRIGKFYETQIDELNPAIASQKKAYKAQEAAKAKAEAEKQRVREDAAVRVLNIRWRKESNQDHDDEWDDELSYTSMLTQVDFQEMTKEERDSFDH